MSCPPNTRPRCTARCGFASASGGIFISYCPKLPLFVKRVFRDEDYIKKLANEVELFNIELQQTVEYIRRYGAKSEAA
jgi:hypothetical protein